MEAGCQRRLHSVSICFMDVPALYTFFISSNSQIGHCSNRDSFKKQQNLQKAMEQAKQIVLRTPLPSPIVSTPIDLPDLTGSNIIHIIEDIAGEDAGKQNATLEELN